MNIKFLLKSVLKWTCAIFLFMGLLIGNDIFAQSGSEISGVITDESGMPLPGVNIVEKGTKNGASTDFDGKFSIKLKTANAQLSCKLCRF